MGQLQAQRNLKFRWPAVPRSPPRARCCIREWGVVGGCLSWWRVDSRVSQGGAGESGFCYEAGAPAGVAPEDALGSGGWGKTENTEAQRAAAQRSARC